MMLMVYLHQELLDASLQALISLNIGNCSNAKPAEKEALLQALYNPLTLYANNDTGMCIVLIDCLGTWHMY